MGATGDDSVTNQIIDIFRCLDTKGDGTISHGEFTHILRTLSAGAISDSDAEQLIAGAQTGVDGRIQYAAFLKWVTSDGPPEGLADPVAFAAMERPAGWIDCASIDRFLSEPLRMLVAVDGTECSFRGFEYVVKEVVQHHRETSLRVMHVFDDAKTYLPVKFRRNHIETTCETLCTSYLLPQRYHLVVEPRVPGEKVGLRFVKEIKSWHADFMCLGFYGLKGRKDRSERLFASNVMEVLQRGRCSCIVMQNEDVASVPQRRPVVFVVSVSLNPAATKAFIDALKLSKPGDEIRVVYVTQHDEGPENTAGIREKYAGLFSGLKDGEQKVLSRFGDRTAVFQLVKKEKGDTTAQAVVRYAEAAAADFVIVGTNSLRVDRGKPILGSVSLQICLECPCNFIVSNYIRENERHIRTPPTR